MNNDEAMAALVDKRAAINAAINGLDEYVYQAVTNSNWSSTVKTRKMAAVQAVSDSGGVDLSTWDGTAA